MRKEDTLVDDPQLIYSYYPSKLQHHNDEVSSLLEESKTMLKVGGYHENIVSLQDITVHVEAGSIYHYIE